jgi:hypothetical protein
MSTSTNQVPLKRKRNLAAKLTDADNVAQPALKQQRLALEQSRKAHVEDVDDIDTTATTCSPIPLDLERHLGLTDGSDDDIPSISSSTPSSRTATVILDSDGEDILQEFTPKKWGGKVKATKGSGDKETAEEELARLMKTWDAPIYGLYEPIPDIQEVNNRRSHVFKCAAVGCNYRVKRYLDTNDRGSTSNLRSHAKKCWGIEAFEKACAVKVLSQVREVVGKLKNMPNGNIAAMFSNLEGKGVVTYMHRQHTTEEARIEIVKWVAESMRPLSIVEDRGFHTLMKTGRGKYHIPSAKTVARDVKHVFKKTKDRIGKILRDYDGRLSFGTDGWTAPNHKAYVAITVHFMNDGAPYCLLLDIVELARSHSGANLARAFADVLKEFGIEDKVSLCTI